MTSDDQLSVPSHTLAEEELEDFGIGLLLQERLGPSEGDRLSAVGFLQAIGIGDLED